MLNVRLAGDHLFGKLLFTWLSLVVSWVMSFCAVLFPMRCLGWDLELNWVIFWGFSFLLIQMIREEKSTGQKWVKGCNKAGTHLWVNIESTLIQRSDTESMLIQCGYIASADSLVCTHGISTSAMHMWFNSVRPHEKTWHHKESKRASLDSSFITILLISN